MAKSLPRPSSSASAAPLVAVLVLTLCVAGAITWVAWLSTNSHRAAAEDAMRDYAEFATANFADAAGKALYGGSMAILSSVNAGSATMDADHVYPLSTLQNAAGQTRDWGWMYVPTPRYVFSYDLSKHTVQVTGDTVPAGVELQRLQDSLSANFDTVAASKSESESHGRSLYVMSDSVANGTEIFLMAYMHGVRGAPDMVYGFATGFRTYAQTVLPQLAQATPLVPRSLSHGLPNDSLLAITVRDANGHEIYQSPSPGLTAFGATQRLWTLIPDGPTVQIAIRQQAADVLLRGGIPRNRVPLLVALLLCTGALVVVAFHLARRAEELAHLRADFTSSMSHELRTPLAQIVLFAESLSFGRVTTESGRSDALRVILREARRLGHLVDNVLLFSRTERRATHVSAQARPLAPIVREIVESFEPLARVRRAALVLSLDQTIVAPVDEGALRQILLNLLDNAVKYGPDGQTVGVSLKLERGRAVLCVDDEGDGVPASESQRIWDPFVRLHSGEYSVSTGSGIGLSVVRQLVTLHGGTCRVDEAPSGGARFVVELPGARVGRADEGTGGGGLPSEGGAHDLAAAR
ncbi:MAG TPA: HAMP domain-containing sensor histidine kinase [Gemmatimonadaceae bacterium]|nr:HAMP domain-containing sensor histidine kinase [Gemmatimonadaceae bacterium]